MNSGKQQKEIRTNNTSSPQNITRRRFLGSVLGLWGAVLSLPCIYIFFIILAFGFTGYILPIKIKAKNEPVKYYKDFIYRASVGWLILLALIFTLAVMLPKDTGKAFNIYNLTETPARYSSRMVFYVFVSDTKIRIGCTSGNDGTDNFAVHLILILCTCAK